MSSFLVTLIANGNSMKNISLMFYLMLIVFILPIFSLCLIYFWIIVYIRNHRDRIILQRICLVVLSLSIPVVISAIIFSAFVIDDHWIFYRLNWMILSISYVFISLSSIYITPEIYRRRNPPTFIPSVSNPISSGQMID